MRHLLLALSLGVAAVNCSRLMTMIGGFGFAWIMHVGHVTSHLASAEASMACCFHTDGGGRGDPRRPAG